VGGGTFLMSYLQKPKEGENKQVQPQSININIPQQQQAAGGKTVIINKGGGTTPATAAPKPKKKEGDEFKEKPAQW
jgi:hypothetical protein